MPSVDTSDFLFTVCQVGAEAALKDEIRRAWPELRLAFSRPGFVTLRLPPGHPLRGEAADLKSTFARTCGHSLGRVAGTDVDEMARWLWNLAGNRPYAQLHVWQRDAYLPGERGFEPGISSLAADVATRLIAARPAGVPPLPVNQTARSGQRILDCVLVDPSLWWVGAHRASTVPSRWPGGVCPEPVPGDIVSRAYRKLQEAMLWSQLPFMPGDVCAEIGSAPGGAAQALLDRGLNVVGIDPAAIHPRVLEHPRFRHIQKRSADVKRREFATARWLVADSNVAPKYTLDAVESIVTHAQVHIRGLLLTLKLLEWTLAERIPEYLARIRGWGYRDVRARQLATNRREFCVAAMRSRSQRRQLARTTHRPRPTQRKTQARQL